MSLNLSPTILKLLNNRGIEGEEEIAEFLSDRPQKTYDPSLLDDIEAVLARGGDAGVEHHVAGFCRALQQPSVVVPLLVKGGGGGDAGGGDAEGIDPGVALHAALVTLGHHPLQGIPARVLAAGARDVLAPGFEARPVVGVAVRAHMEADAGEVLGLHVVEVGGETSLDGALA